MNKKLIIGLILGLFSLISCENEAPKSTTTTKIEAKDSTQFTPDVFHNYIVLKVDEVNAVINKLQVLDDENVAPEIILDAAKKSHLSLDSIIKNLTTIIPSGTLGAEVKEMTLSYINSKKAIIDVYIEFAPQLSIEAEWSDEDYTLWTSNAEPYFGVSEQIWEDLNVLMNQYVDENNISKTYL